MIRYDRIWPFSKWTVTSMIFIIVLKIYLRMMMTQISGDIKSGRYPRTNFFETTEKANGFTEATGGIVAHHDSLASVLMRDHKQTWALNQRRKNEQI